MPLEEIKDVYTVINAARRKITDKQVVGDNDEYKKLLFAALGTGDAWENAVWELDYVEILKHEEHRKFDNPFDEVPFPMLDDHRGEQIK